MSSRYDHEQAREGVDSLRTRMDADARFHRVLSGYDPEEVRAYVEDVRRTFALQAKAAKQEQEALISDLESARSEIQARNCAIKTLKDALAQKENELTALKSRALGLAQSVRTLEAERTGVEQLRVAAAAARVASERAQALEKETQRLRTTLSQAASLIESWKAERERLLEENARLKEELEDLRSRTAAEARMGAGGRAAPENGGEQKETGDVIPAQIADKLADTFAEAYSLVSQFRTGGEPPRSTIPQRTAPPRMQVLRPDGTFAEHGSGNKA